MRHKSDHAPDCAAQKRNCRGSTLIVTISTILVLSLLAGEVLRVAVRRYRQLAQADSWHEALSAAEAGADLGIVALRSMDWTGWQGPDANGIRTYNMPALTQGGEGNAAATAVVQVDSPPSFITTDGVFYRIRSTGRANLPGGGSTGADRYDNRLRHLSLLKDRDTGAMVAGSPLVSRTIEVIAKPSALFNYAFSLTNSVIGKSSSSLVDSFDSGDPTKSTNSLYDPAKRQSNGNISSNDSTGSDLSDMTVYGTLGYSGPTIPNTQNVQGAITTPYAQQILPVSKPNWTTSTANVGLIKASATFTAGAAGSPTRYIASGVQVTATSNPLTIVAPSSGGPGEVEFWIQGDVQMNSQIIIPPNVKVTFWFEGNMSIAGNSVVNGSNLAANAIFNGVTPTDGSARSITVTGGGSATAVFNAPAYDISIGSSGAVFYGAFIAKTMTFKNGGVQIHYDEALGRMGGGPDYAVLSFAEDVR